jgi:hypothetical protein
MLDLDQRPQLPISPTSGNGFDIGQMVGSVGARRVPIAGSEIFLRIVPNGFNQVFYGSVGCLKFCDEIQVWALRTIEAIVLREQNRQARLGDHDLGLFPSTTGHL